MLRIASLSTCYILHLYLSIRSNSHFHFSILVYMRLESIRTGVMEEAAESKRPRAKALNKASRKASPMLEP